MDDITRLKKTIENRESTITFLNDLLDGQSRKIDELKTKYDKLNEYCDDISKSWDKLFEENGEQYYKIVELEKENKTLKAKLSVLFNAFESIKEPKEEKTTKVSNDKEQHDKELNHPQWKKKREEVFERYGHQCVECGKTKNIEVHHLLYRKGRHLWEYDTSELIPLCRKCHKKVHEDKTHRFHEKYVS